MFDWCNIFTIKSFVFSWFINNTIQSRRIFNSSINGIEDADLIFLIGANPRYEATILNARIRKAFVNNNSKVISLNDVGDLTYPYKNLDGQTQDLSYLG